MTTLNTGKTGVAAAMDQVAQEIRETCCLDALAVYFKSENKAEKDRKAWITDMHNAGMISANLEDGTRPERNILHAEYGKAKLTGRDATLYKITDARHMSEAPETDKVQRTKLRKRGDTWLREVIADLKTLENPSLAADTGTGANSSGKAKWEAMTRSMASLHTAQRVMAEYKEKSEGDLDTAHSMALAAFTQVIDQLRASNPVIKSEFDKFARGELIAKIDVKAKK